MFCFSDLCFYEEHFIFVSSDELIVSVTFTDTKEEIFELMEEATSATIGGTPDARLEAAMSWIKLAVEWSDSSSALEAYRKSLELLRVVLITGSSLESRHGRLTSRALKETQNLAVDGAACAIDSGKVEMALEMLEQGRSLLLTEAGRYRTPVDGLDDTLAAEFRDISMKMEASAMTAGIQNVDPSSNQTTEDAVAAYVRYRILETFLTLAFLL